MHIRFVLPCFRFVKVLDDPELSEGPPWQMYDILYAGQSKTGSQSNRKMVTNGHSKLHGQVVLYRDTHGMNIPIINVKQVGAYQGSDLFCFRLN